MPTPAVVLLVPGDLNLRTGGYGYDREIVAGLRTLGWTVDVRTLDGSFPFPTGDARAHAAATLTSLPDGTLVLADGLAFGTMAEEAAAEAARLRFVALVHHPLALESGLSPAQTRAFEQSETQAIAASRGVVVTSEATAAALEWYGVAATRVAVVHPGTAPAPLARGTANAGRGPVSMLAVASLVERKGYDVLLTALASLQHLDWRLECVGSHTLQPKTAAAIVEQVRVSGLEHRVTFAGELGQEALDAAYDRADVFVLATRYEGYGMAVAEAVARGLPVVSTSTGAIPDLVGRNSGMLLEPDTIAGWTEALGLVLSPDSDLRQRLADGARLRRDALPRWDDAARAMAAALSRFSTDGLLQR